MDVEAIKRGNSGGPLYLLQKDVSGLVASLLGVAIASAAAVAQVGLTQFTGPPAAPFMLLLFAVILAPLVAGRSAGVACLLVSTGAAAHFLDQQADPISLGREEPVTLVLFFLIGSLIVVLCSELRRSQLENERARVALNASVDQFRAFIDHLPVAVWTTDLSGSHIYANAGWADLTGLPRTNGSFRELFARVHEEDREAASARWDRCLRTGEPLDLLLRLPSGELTESRWHIIRAQRLVTDADSAGMWCGACFDVHDQKLSEEREVLLSKELDHRTKNMLAIIQSVVQLTKAADLPAYKEAVGGRIHALARAHQFLVSSRWQGAPLRVLAESELAAFAQPGTRYELEGPDVALSRVLTQSLTLVLHELATNARKYGALSVSGGAVLLSWNLCGLPAGERLRIEWIEQGGPAASPPEHSGFGSKMIKHAIEGHLSGSLETEWRTDGLQCSIEVPLGE